jgi:hypothetical protein
MNIRILYASFEWLNIIIHNIIHYYKFSNILIVLMLNYEDINTQVVISFVFLNIIKNEPTEKVSELKIYGDNLINLKT